MDNCEYELLTLERQKEMSSCAEANESYIDDMVIKNIMSAKSDDEVNQIATEQLYQKLKEAIGI